MLDSCLNSARKPFLLQDYRMNHYAVRLNHARVLHLVDTPFKTVSPNSSPSHRYSSLLQREEDLKEIRAEVRMMLSLQSCVGVVALHDVFDDEDSVNLIMEHCSGGDLFDYVARHKRLTERQAADIIR